MEPAAEPKISLRQISVAGAADKGLWSIAWEVENCDGVALKINSVRLPHGQFKSVEQTFDPPLEVASDGRAAIQCLVHCHEPAGLVTENAFVIFHCQWRGQGWRIFVRIRVTVNDKGEPETATELVTTQRIGFSGIAN